MPPVYAVGVLFSYFSSRYFIFRQTVSARSSIPKYVLALAVAFAVNQAVLLGMSKMLGPAPAMRFLAQVVAMGTYTVVNFTLCRVWVFRAARP